MMRGDNRKCERAAWTREISSGSRGWCTAQRGCLGSKAHALFFHDLRLLKARIGRYAVMIAHRDCYTQTKRFADHGRWTMDDVTTSLPFTVPGPPSMVYRLSSSVPVPDRPSERASWRGRARREMEWLALLGSKVARRAQDTPGSPGLA